MDFPIQQVGCSALLNIVWCHPIFYTISYQLTQENLQIQKGMTSYRGPKSTLMKHKSYWQWQYGWQWWWSSSAGGRPTSIMPKWQDVKTDGSANARYQTFQMFKSFTILKKRTIQFARDTRKYIQVRFFLAKNDWTKSVAKLSLIIVESTFI